MYRSLLSLSSFIFVKPIRSTFDPTYTCRIIVHGCLLGHYFFYVFTIRAFVNTQLCLCFENANISGISIYPAIFTRISLALVHSTQDVRGYEARLFVEQTSLTSIEVPQSLASKLSSWSLT